MTPKQPVLKKRNPKKKKRSKKIGNQEINKKASNKIKKERAALKDGKRRKSEKNKSVRPNALVNSKKDKNLPVQKKRKRISNRVSRRKMNRLFRRLQRFTRNKNVRKTVRTICDFIAISVSLFLVIIVICSFFFSLNRVNGYSMSPNLQNDNLLLVSKTAEINRLDLLVFDRRNSIEVRRVIGLPGDRIEYLDDVLYVNGEIINEPYIIEHINEAQRNGGQYTEDFNMQLLTGEAFVPEDSYFVMGDNREWATDSREYGFIEKEQIIGTVKMRLLPINNLTTFTIVQLNE